MKLVANNHHVQWELLKRFLKFGEQRSMPQQSEAKCTFSAERYISSITCWFLYMYASLHVTTLRKLFKQDCLLI